MACINLGVTTNLRDKGLSVSQLEDWKISNPSFDLIPTVPLTFDEVYWEAYWQVINKPAPVMREVMIYLENETKEKNYESEHVKIIHSQILHQSNKLEENKSTQPAENLQIVNLI